MTQSDEELKTDLCKEIEKEVLNMLKLLSKTQKELQKAQDQIRLLQNNNETLNAEQQHKLEQLKESNQLAHEKLIEEHQHLLEHERQQFQEQLQKQISESAAALQECQRGFTEEITKLNKKYEMIEHKYQALNRRIRGLNL